MSFDALQTKKNLTVQKKSNSQAQSLPDFRNKSITQLQPNPLSNNPVQKRENNTGLPNNLKSGMENLSGYSLDHVRVHYNSPKPATVQAYAYAQGSDIHLASGQEKHLPHELGHVVQQMEGRVKPTTNVGGIAVNDSSLLENEADVLGAKALSSATAQMKPKSNIVSPNSIIQRIDWGWWGGQAAGAVGGTLGGVVGAAKGLYKEGLKGVMPGLKEGATEGYERPGVAVGTVLGGAIGHSLGTMGAVVGGVGAAGRSLYKKGSVSNALVSGAAGALAGYYLPTISGAMVGGAVGKRINDKVKPPVPWQAYINPKDFKTAKKLPYPGRMYDRDKSPGFQKGMEQAIRQELMGKNVNNKVDYDEYVRMHDLVTGHFKHGRHMQADSREDMRTLSSADEAVSFPIQDWGDDRVGLAEDMNDEVINGTPLVHTWKESDGLMKTDQRGHTFYTPDGRIRVNYSQEKGIEIVKAILNRYHGEVGKAKTKEGKITAIVKAIRAIHVAHPFKDANGRLHGQILLNKFLIQQGFRPSILGERGLGIFGGGLSLDELSEEVTAGMERSKHLK